MARTASDTSDDATNNDKSYTNDNDSRGKTDSATATKWLRACSLDDVKSAGQLCEFRDNENRHCILVANHKGTIHATDLICTHADADLSAGFLGPDGIRCPLHLSVFDLKSGMPQNPPAEKPLRVYNIKIDNGQVYVGV